MISRYPCERRCAVCAEHVRVGKDHRGRLEEVKWLSGAVDGRPGFTDVSSLADAWYIEECPECGHLAPDLSAEYRALAYARDSRAELLGLDAHDRRALRCLAVANLFTDDQPREQGLWVLRAAWFDESAGRGLAARALRRRAAPLLEDALFEGYALHEDRLGSALMIAECYRLGGAFDRALEHCARVLANSRDLDREARSSLVYEVECIIHRLDAPATRREAVDAVKTLSKEHLRSLQRLVEDARAKLKPLRLRRARPSAPGEHRDLVSEAKTFARAYLDDDLLIALLAEGRLGVWDAVSVHSRFFPQLLRATDHAEPSVRKNALQELYDKQLGFASDILRGHEGAVAALARRLGDEDPQLVRWAGAIAKQVIRLDPSFLRILVDAARVALPRWKAELSTEGVLERLIAMETSGS